MARGLTVGTALTITMAHMLQALRPISVALPARAFGRVRIPSQRFSPVNLPTTLLAASAAAAWSNRNATLPSSSTVCAPLEFPSEYLQYDHYNGVTLTLTDSFSMETGEFEETLRDSLATWRAECRKGLWIHVAPSQSDKIQICIEHGFDFHMVVQNREESTRHSSHENGSSDHSLAQLESSPRCPRSLVLTQWLPNDIPNRLPLGPSHQVGVGCLIFHPHDWSPSNASRVPPELRRMLVVQERTGPAAAWKLWKMPTGLTDPGEDVHVAAVRECKEETGLDTQFCGILAIRQAHAQPSIRDNKNVVMRSHSDLFVICIMQLDVKQVGESAIDDLSTLETCPDEIAGIQWMTVQDYCNQERWQASPVYLELNRAILNASQQTLFDAVTLPLGFSSNITSTNTLYRSALLD